MGSLRNLRRPPILLLGLLVVAFVAWLGWDALHAPADDPGQTAIERATLALPAPMLPPKRFRGAGKREQFSPQEHARAIPRLKPGMMRAEVEELVGIPLSQNTLPATVRGDQVTYQTTYEADMAPPVFARLSPTRLPPPPRDTVADARDRIVITLEYDATKPGHPLLGIYYPDPLF